MNVRPKPQNGVPRGLEAGTSAGKAALAAVLAIATNTAHAELVNATRIVLSIQGNPVVNAHGGGPNAPATASGTRNEQGVQASFSADANQSTAASASLSGTGSATLVATASTAYDFKLVPPAGVDVKGHTLVLHGVLEGTVSGGELHLMASAQFDAAVGNASAAATIDHAGTPKAPFDLALDVHSFSDSGDLQGRIRLQLDAKAGLSGGSSASSSAQGSSTTRIAGFRVVDSSGAQTTGFTMTADGGAIPEIGTAQIPAPIVSNVAVEFFNAQLGHYFVTSIPAEISALDSGRFAGWSRTGESFKVNGAAGPGLAAVCRFFTLAFPPASSHFYTAIDSECQSLKAGSTWQFETVAFHMAMPGASGCPAATLPVYRLYNNGQGGAPNHRFTTSDSTRTQMLAKGYVAEGSGTGVGMCAPQ